MANIKSAISLQKSLFDQVEALAHEKKVSRSRLFVMALEDYLRHEQTANWPPRSMRCTAASLIQPMRLCAAR